MLHFSSSNVVERPLSPFLLFTVQFMILSIRTLLPFSAPIRPCVLPVISYHRPTCLGFFMRLSERFPPATDLDRAYRQRWIHNWASRRADRESGSTARQAELLCREMEDALPSLALEATLSGIPALLGYTPQQFAQSHRSSSRALPSELFAHVFVEFPSPGAFRDARLRSSNFSDADFHRLFSSEGPSPAVRSPVAGRPGPRSLLSPPGSVDKTSSPSVPARPRGR